MHSEYYLNGHLRSMQIVESSDRPRITLQNAISCVEPVTLRKLLYGVDDLEFTENKKIMDETLKFIHEAKRFK